MNNKTNKTSLYEDVLVGDFFPESWLRRFSKYPEFFWKDILSDENRLHHLYVHSLKDNVRILRTPTTYCTTSWLEETGLKDKTEAIANLSISKAKQAREEMQADILIAGCVGPVKNFEQKNEDQIRAELEELIVYLADFEADSLLVQNIADENLMKITLDCIRRITGQPLAVFFEGYDFAKEDTFKILEDLCFEFEIELCGVKISAQSADYRNLYSDFMKLSLGVLLENPPKKEKDFQNLIKEFEVRRPVMILGGETFSREYWRKFISHI